MDGAAVWSVCFVDGVGVVGRPTMSLGLRPIVFDAVDREEDRDMSDKLDVFDACRELVTGGPVSPFSATKLTYV